MEIIQWNGKTITKPGIYAGIPLDVYHNGIPVKGQPRSPRLPICDGPSVSSSTLRTIVNESPAHYWVDSPYNPERDPDAGDDTEKKHFILGRAAHHLFLGQPNFRKEFTTRPEMLDDKAWHGNRTACRDWLEKAAAAHLSVLTPDMAKSVLGMSKTLAAEPLIKSGLLAGKVEHSMIARGRNGTWIKVRPDAIPTDAHDFADFKSTTSVDEDAVQRSIGSFGYHMQGALVWIVARLLGFELSSFTLVFQETKPPYAVRIVGLKPNVLARGAVECLVALRIFESCLKASDALPDDRKHEAWPGPAGHQRDVQWAELSKWEGERRDYRLQHLRTEYSVPNDIEPSTAP